MSNAINQCTLQVCNLISVDSFMLNNIILTKYYFHSLFYIFQPHKTNTTFFFSSNISDERDAIQKKTFTKWVNKHLKKVIHDSLL